METSYSLTSKSKNSNRHQIKIFPEKRCYRWQLVCANKPLLTRFNPSFGFSQNLIRVDPLYLETEHQFVHTFGVMLCLLIETNIKQLHFWILDGYFVHRNGVISRQKRKCLYDVNVKTCIGSFPGNVFRFWAHWNQIYMFSVRSKTNILILNTDCGLCFCIWSHY